MAEHSPHPEHPFGNTGLLSKFKNAFAGLLAGIRGQNSFYFHLPIAVAVVAAALVLQVNFERLLILLLCIGLVLVAELLNSAIERACRAITREYNEDIRIALDIASGAVLLAALAAATVGAMVFLAELFS